MRVKIHEQKMKDKKEKGEKIVSLVNEYEQKKEERKENPIKCKDRFWLDPRDKFLSTFDTFMLLIVAYSCFSAAYFTAFDFPTERDSVAMLLEHIVLGSFFLDIAFNFIRIPENDGIDKIRDHSTVAKKYMKSG